MVVKDLLTGQWKGPLDLLARGRVVLVSPQVRREMGSFVVCAATCCAILAAKALPMSYPLRWTEQMNDVTHTDTTSTLFMSRHTLVFLKGCYWVTPPPPCSVILHLETFQDLLRFF